MANVSTEQILTPPTMQEHQSKGGEKEMVSRWEELESLSKEELIVRLVRSEFRFKTLLHMAEGIGEEDLEGILYDDCVQHAPEHWAVAVARLYVKENGTEGLCDGDFMDYGLDRRSAQAAYVALRRDGTITSDEFDWDGMYEMDKSS